MESITKNRQPDRVPRAMIALAYGDDAVPEGDGFATELGVTHRRTRPYRPQTNGKIERFHRTLAHGWAYSKHYNSEKARRAALPAWMHFFNHHRQPSAIGKVPPITRLNNLPGHYR